MNVFQSFSGFLIVFSSALAVTATAEEDPAVNFREKCRRTVSGTYGSVLADKVQAEDALIQSENFKRKSQTLRDSEEAKMKTIKKKIASSEYSAQLLHEQEVSAALIKVYHEQWQSSENQWETAKKNLVTTKTREAKLRKNIESIFNIIMNEDPDGNPRPLFNRLEWKSPCPKYRSLCPLPERDAKTLVALTDDIDDPDLACHRYAKLK